MLSQRSVFCRSSLQLLRYDYLALEAMTHQVPLLLHFTLTILMLDLLVSPPAFRQFVHCTPCPLQVAKRVQITLTRLT